MKYRKIHRIFSPLMVLSISLATSFVAANQALAAGDANDQSACINEALPGFRASMPDCRAYEMVSPTYKAGARVNSLAISPDGSRVLVNSNGGFAGTGNNELNGFSDGGAFYILSRSATGWLTEPLNPSGKMTSHSGYLAASGDLSKTLWQVIEEPSPPGTELLNAETRYGLVLRVPRPGQEATFEPIGPEDNPAQTTNFRNFIFEGASSDLSHILYSVEAKEGATWPGDTTTKKSSLYEYTGAHNGEPMLVGVRNKGILEGGHVNEHAELISTCGIELGGASKKYNAVSRDGATIVFTARVYTKSACKTEGANALYARVGETETVAISQPEYPLAQGSGSGPEECGATCESATHRAAVFQGASEGEEGPTKDESKVFFTTTQPLLNGDEGGAGTGNDLYEAELEGAHLKRLIQVSHDPNPGEAANVQGVARISENGERVYFVATNALTSSPNGEGKSPANGQDNLYVYDASEGKLTFVATLAGADERDWMVEDDRRPFQITRSGGYAVFLSSAQLTADDSSTVAQLFEYNAETEKLTRVSIGQQGSGYLCPATDSVEIGFNCNGNVTLPDYAPRLARGMGFASEDAPTGATTGLSLTEDGRVFFLSLDALTPSAVEDKKNIYEYSNGNVYLIAAGEDGTLEYAAFGEEPDESERLVGTDATGTDLFLGSVGGLVPQDTDSQADLYDAREGGGFQAAAVPAACHGESCQPASAGAPTLLSAPSSVLSGEPAIEAQQQAQQQRPVRPKPLTRTQKLIKALKACGSAAKRKRHHCELEARRRYGTRTVAKLNRGGK